VSARHEFDDKTDDKSYSLFFLPNILAAISAASRCMFGKT